MKVLKCDFCNLIIGIQSFHFGTRKFIPCPAGGVSEEEELRIDLCPTHLANIFKYAVHLLKKTTHDEETSMNEYKEFIDYLEKNRND